MALADTPNEPPPLYPGEVLHTIAGFPTIYHYQPPSSAAAGGQCKPLVVCVTGGLHLARIFYGGHKASNSRDFLAYWLSQHGFGVLSLSYPLETEPQIMPPTAAMFRIQDWGRQAAATTKQVIDQHPPSSRSVILISWSMGGRMVVPFSTSAREMGLEVQQYISFAATPGISSIRPLPPGMTCSPNGYFNVPSRLEVFCRQLKHMEELNGGREIIPRDVYRREYTGGTPINLIGLRLKYDGKGEFVQDELTHEEDTQVLDVSSFPVITAIYPTSIMDASHALADQASWGFLLTYKLESMIGEKGLSHLEGTERWQQILDLVHSAPTRLCVPMYGNHFFFVGEQSARDVAQRISNLAMDARQLQDELSALVA